MCRPCATCYKDFTIHEVQARRNVNSNASRRGKVGEVLITSTEIRQRPRSSHRRPRCRRGPREASPTPRPDPAPSGRSRRGAHQANRGRALIPGFRDLWCAASQNRRTGARSGRRHCAKNLGYIAPTMQFVITPQGPRHKAPIACGASELRIGGDFQESEAAVAKITTARRRRRYAEVADGGAADREALLRTEFHEDGNTIDLISIGIVAEDGARVLRVQPGGGAVPRERLGARERAAQAAAVRRAPVERPEAVDVAPVEVARRDRTGPGGVHWRSEHINRYRLVVR